MVRVGALSTGTGNFLVHDHVRARSFLKMKNIGLFVVKSCETISKAFRLTSHTEEKY